MKGFIADKALIEKIFAEYRLDVVVNLAAQAGARYSIYNPDTYVESKLIGFYNILEANCHSFDNGTKGMENLVNASSYCIYRTNKKVPISLQLHRRTMSALNIKWYKDGEKMA